MSLERIEWPRDDSRWLYPLWQALTCDGGIKRGLVGFRLLLDRADPNLSDHGRTILHTVMARGADPIEKDAAPWARPMAWAQKMKRDRVIELLLNH